MTRFVALLFSLIAVSTFGIEQDISAEYVGKYTTKKQECTGNKYVELNSKSIKFNSGSFNLVMDNVDHCYSCEGGARYSGIVVWLFPEFGVVSPSRAVLTLNHGEEIGMLGVELKEPNLVSNMGFERAVLSKCP